MANHGWTRGEGATEKCATERWEARETGSQSEVKCESFSYRLFGQKPPAGMPALPAPRSGKESKQLREEGVKVAGKELVAVVWTGPTLVDGGEWIVDGSPSTVRQDGRIDGIAGGRGGGEVGRISSQLQIVLVLVIGPSQPFLGIHHQSAGRFNSRWMEAYASWILL